MEQTPTPFDISQLRAEMSAEDPEFAHVREVHHDALNTIAAHRLEASLSLQREREFWQARGSRKRRPEAPP